MTTSPYSLDLRQKVIEYLKNGNSYNKTSKIFNISISAIGRWYRRYKNEGHYNPLKRPGAKRKIAIELLEQYVKANPDMTLKKCAEHFKVSDWTICFWLKKLNFSYKKKNIPTWKQKKNSGRSI